jgi:ankyrin repeat protein
VGGAYRSGAKVTADELIRSKNTSAYPHRLLVIDAVRSGNLDAVKCLVEAGANGYDVGNCGWTCLLEAENIDIARYLVEECRMDANTGCPLHVVRNPEVVKYLIEHGADVNERNPFQGTPLHQAKSLEVVRCLVENKADVNITDSKGNTPLHEMMCFLDVDAVKYMVEVGKADMNIKNHAGRTVKEEGILFGEHVDYLQTL